MRKILQLFLIALAGALCGIVIAYYPSLRDDLRFLHAARMMAEYQAMQQQQQQQNSGVVMASPGKIEPGGVLPTPEKNEKKDEKKK
jgi:hypothetical protein